MLLRVPTIFQRISAAFLVSMPVVHCHLKSRCKAASDTFIHCHLLTTDCCAAQLQRAKNKPMLRIPLNKAFLQLQFDSLEDRDAVVETLGALTQQTSSNSSRQPAAGQFSGPPALVAIKKQLLDSDK